MGWEMSGHYPPGVTQRHIDELTEDEPQPPEPPPFEPAAYVEALRVAAEAFASLPEECRPYIGAASLACAHVRRLAAHVGSEVMVHVYHSTAATPAYAIEGLSKSIHGIYVQSSMRPPTLEELQREQREATEASAKADIPF